MAAWQNGENERLYAQQMAGKAEANYNKVACNVTGQEPWFAFQVVILVDQTRLCAQSSEISFRHINICIEGQASLFDVASGRAHRRHAIQTH